MSSIDKYVVSEAKKYNSNVQVVNSNGYITGTLNGTVVFRIADRHGFLNSSEESIIREAMQNYERRERERREREERLRQMREEQRQREIQTTRNLIDSKINELNRSRATAMSNRNNVPQITYNKELLSGFNVGALESRINSAKSAYTTAYNEIDRSYSNASANLERIKSSITNSMSLESAQSRHAEVQRVRCSFTVDSGIISNVVRLRNEIMVIENSARVVNAMLTKLKSATKGQVEFEVTRILNSIREYDVTSTEDMKNLVGRIEQQLVELKGKQAGEISSQVKESLNAIDEAISESKTLQLQIQESTYEIRSFEEEIKAEQNKIREAVDALRMAEYTTCTEEVFAELENFLMESNGATDEEILRKAQRYSELCTSYATEDERYHLQYEIYKKAIARVSQLPGCDILDEMTFDVKNGEEGIASQLERLCEKEVEWMLENAKATTELHLTMADDIMTDMGYSLLACDAGEENDMASVAYYTRKGWDGVVMQVIATENGVERKLIGVSRNGQRTKAQQILNIANQIEQENEPFQFLQKFNDNMITQCKVRNEGDITTDTENVEELIEQDVVFDLSQNRMVTVKDRLITIRQWFDEITNPEMVEKSNTYEKITGECKNCTKQVEAISAGARNQTVSKTRKRYQN